MKKLIFTILLFLLPLIANAQNWSPETVIESSLPDTSKVEKIANKIIFTDWLKQTTLKTVFISSVLAHHGFRGMNEGYDWGKLHGDTYIVNNTNSHFYGAAEMIAGISHGWTLYATMTNKQQTFFQKTKRIIGAELLGAVAFEMMYKEVRYNNPFDYSEEHNKCAFVYFSFKDGQIVDSYLSLGPRSGPIVHGIMVIIGTALFASN